MGQLPSSAFQAYDPSNASSIQPGPFALYSVAVNQILPTQMNEGFAEVDAKISGCNLVSPSNLQSTLLTDIEPVVIGPDGKLYLLNGHHTFTSLLESNYGASNPTVYVNVVANYSNLTESQFWTQMQAGNLVLPLNDGVPQTLNVNTGSPIPTSLTGLTNDPYRGLERNILKNKSSVLFSGGATTPGLDKMNGFYSDFIWAQAYRDANGGLGLSYLSPSDIAQSTQWNLNGNSATTMPNISGTVTVAQLPGFILGQDITISTTISNATLANGTLDGNGTFTGHTSFTFGSTTLGTVQSGLVMQLGADAGHTVTLSGPNTYTGGTTILAGTLIVANDAALGAAAPASYSIDPNNITSSVEAANGIIFNSLSEGAGTLKLGTTSGAGTSTFTTNRPIAVGGETATINLNGYITTLTGTIISVGSNGTGIGAATGVSDLTIADTSSGSKGVLECEFLRQLDHFQRHTAGTERCHARQHNRSILRDRSDRSRWRHIPGRCEFLVGAQPVPDRGQHLRHRRIHHLVFRHDDRRPAHTDGHQQQHQYCGRGDVRIVQCRCHGVACPDRRDQGRDGDVHERHHAHRQRDAVHRPIEYDFARHH